MSRPPASGSPSARAEPAGDARPVAAGVPTAVVHDWFQGLHGSERVVDAIRTGLCDPGAPPDVYTFRADRTHLPPALAAAIVRESHLGRALGPRFRYALPSMPLFFRRLDLEPYDLVVSSSHAFAGHARPRPDAAHVLYCHTPARYVWLPEVDERRPGAAAALALRGLRGPLRRLDRRAAQRPGAVVANSTAVRARIRRFWGRDAVVVHPPVDVGDFDHTLAKEPGRFVWAQRLVAYKRPQLVAEAFRGLPYRLTMIGVGPLEDALRRDLPANVELRGWLPREELTRVLGEAVGFVHAAEEDFGIATVEALAAGTPVVALARGGAVDVVRDGTDGVLVETPTLEAIRAGIRTVAAAEFDRAVLRSRADEFGRERFLAAFGGVVAAALAAR